MYTCSHRYTYNFSLILIIFIIVNNRKVLEGINVRLNVEITLEKSPTMEETQQEYKLYHIFVNRIGGVIVSVFAYSAVNHGFKPRSGQTKDYKLGIGYFSAKQAG